MTRSGDKVVPLNADIHLALCGRELLQAAPPPTVIVGCLGSNLKFKRLSIAVSIDVEDIKALVFCSKIFRLPYMWSNKAAYA